MNFEEKLDRFISTNAPLKPIVLKLVEALEKIQSGEDEIEIAPDHKINRFSRVDMCAIADMTLAEIEQMIGGGK